MELFGVELDLASYFQLLETLNQLIDEIQAKDYLHQADDINDKNICGQAEEIYAVA